MLRCIAQLLNSVLKILIVVCHKLLKNALELSKSNQNQRNARAHSDNDGVVNQPSQDDGMSSVYVDLSR